MSLLSPRLQLRVAQKQILTPGLVQMVTVLQLNRLELKEMINQEMAENPVLEESAEMGEEMTPEEVQALLERERLGDPADSALLQSMSESTNGCAGHDYSEGSGYSGSRVAADAGPPLPSKLRKPRATPIPSMRSISARFLTIISIPGIKRPRANRSRSRRLRRFFRLPSRWPSICSASWQWKCLPEDVRDAAMAIIGNLDDDGYLPITLEEIAQSEGHVIEDVAAALQFVQSLDPAGIAARDMRECLLIQIESRNGKGGVAWQIVSNHLKLLETKQFKEIAKQLGRPLEHVQIAVNMIRHLDPRPGLRYSGQNARAVEPDVYIFKDARRLHHSVER